MEQDSTYIVLKKDEFEHLRNMLQSIKNSLDTKKSDIELLDGYLNQRQAEELMQKKTTWFYHKVRSGRLKVYKNGKSNVYHIDDLKALIKSK